MPSSIGDKRGGTAVEHEDQDDDNEEKAETVGEKRTRATQLVSRRVDRTRVVRRMLELSESGATGFKAQVVREFPDLFTGVYKRDVGKASDWWNKRDDILSGKGTSVSARVDGGVKKFFVKALDGRGRKRAEWVNWLYEKLNEEFARMRSLNIKMSRRLIAAAAFSILDESTETWIDDTKKDGSMIRGPALKSRITAKWIDAFCKNHNVVSRHKTGKLAVDAKKQEEIERAVAVHLGQVKRDFDSGILDDDFVFNMDETHFLINMDDGKTLEYKGAGKVKYDDVVSGSEGMTLVVKLRGGIHAGIETPMMIFQNKNCSYPIRGLPDNIPGVTYRTGPRGWMDRRVFKEWLCEDRCVKRAAHDNEQVIFMDNAGGHKTTEEVDEMMKKKHVTIRLLPPNATDLCQPADTTVLQKLKLEWMKEWEQEKVRLATKRQEENKKPKANASGKLPQPGKEFFLRLAVKCCRRVNDMKDEDGVSLVRKGMIRCGLGQNLNGVWEQEQLFPHLQAIIKRFPDEFEGKTLDDEDEEDAEEQE